MRGVDAPDASYRGRLAPSPTGLLHLGHVRTFAVARQRAARGELLLRIDDLDPHRSRAEYITHAIEDLEWLGFTWAGEPWFQSRRMAAYRTAWEQLVQAGYVYACRCSRRDLAEAAHAPHDPGDEPLYPGSCRPGWRPGEEAGAADRAAWLALGPGGANWRFRVPEGELLRWVDGGFGPQAFTAGQHFGDFSLWRRDGVPAYQLAVVVDDAAMGITEVVRGADLLLSAARQLLLYRALALTPPRFFHCPLVLDEQGARLAKRTDALSVRALRAQGHSPAEVLRQP